MDNERCQKCLRELKSKSKTIKNKPETTNKEPKTDCPKKDAAIAENHKINDFLKESIKRPVLKEPCCKKRKCPANIEFSESFCTLLESKVRCCKKSACAVAKRFCDVNEPLYNKCIDLPKNYIYHYLSVDVTTDTKSDLIYSESNLLVEAGSQDRVKETDVRENEITTAAGIELKDLNKDAAKTSKIIDEIIEIDRPRRYSILKTANLTEDSRRHLKPSVVVVLEKQTGEELVSYVNLVEENETIFAEDQGSKNTSLEDEPKENVINQDEEEISNTNEEGFSMEIANVKKIDLEKITEEYEQRSKKRLIMDHDSDERYEDRKRLSIVSWHINESEENLNKGLTFKVKEKSVKELAQEAALNEQRESIRSRSILNEIVDSANQKLRLSKLGPEQMQLTETDDQSIKSSDVYTQRSRIKSTVDTAALLSKLNLPYKKKSSTSSSSKGWLGKLFKNKNPTSQGNELSDGATEKAKNLDMPKESDFDLNDALGKV